MAEPRRMLEETLGEMIGWNKARIKFMAIFILSLIKVQTVNLTKIANVFPGKSETGTHYKRIQRFLKGFEIKYEELAKCLVKMLPGKNDWVLTMDRTNWEMGKSSVNILMIGIVYRGVAWPVMWVVLDKKGNSNTKERKELIEKFIKTFGVKKIKYLTADREFIGEKWIKWLRGKKIDFHIRIRYNTLINTAKGRLYAYQLFEQLPIKQELVWRKSVNIWHQRLWLSGCRLEDGEYLIIIAANFSKNALAEYALRWEIETLFGCLKSRGFNLEDTHLTEPDRIKSLLALLALAFCWVHLVGDWLVAQKPLEIKKHGRLAQSIFRKGLDHLQRILSAFSGKFQIIAFTQVIKLLSCT